MDSILAILVVGPLLGLFLIVVGGLIWLAKSKNNKNEFDLTDEEIQPEGVVEEKKLLFDTSDARVASMLENTFDVLNEHKANVRELVIYYGNLGYILGARIEGYSAQEGGGPGIDELKRMYHTKPTIGVNLMLQGLQVTAWENDLKEQTGKKE